MAEAIANAIEHGLVGRDHGSIRVDLVQTTTGLQLCVTDDGAGLPEGFDTRGSTSLGLKIATTLARQLGGSFDVRSAEPVGAQSVLTIPHSPAGQPPTP
jgi:two-component sensor histidine kinase